MSKEAMKQALDFLRSGHFVYPTKIATDLEEALAKQEQEEPVAVKHMMEWADYLKRKSDYGQHMKIPSGMSAGACWELAVELEQFINTTPQQRKPLTDEQAMDAYCETPPFGTYKEAFIAGVRFIEAAHGIKE